jgi:hypothetical protein
MTSSIDKPERSVDVFREDGKWVVHVVKAGEEATAEFDHERSARSFAAGQRTRLVLPQEAMSR